MTVKQSKRRRIFWWVVVACVFAAVSGLYLTSCQWYQSSQEEGKQQESSAQQDAYEAKIVYYHAQIQSLNNQLTNMEQQLYLMREDYMTQLEALEQKLNTSDSSEGTVSPEDTSSEQDFSIQQDTTTPSRPSSSSGLTDNSDKEEGDSSEAFDQEVQLCEYTYRLENGCAILTRYLGEDQDVVVPAAVDGYLVVGIGDRTFADCNMRSVTIPETIKTMGWFTFYRCEQLQSVVLPASLSSIGYASFDGCPSTLCLHVVSGSYAEQFAISFGLCYLQFS